MARTIKTIILLTLTACCPKADTGTPDTNIDTDCLEQWWYPDNDGDGAGCSGPGFGLYGCEQPDAHWVTIGGDADDCTALTQ